MERGDQLISTTDSPKFAGNDSQVEFTKTSFRASQVQAMKEKSFLKARPNELLNSSQSFTSELPNSTSHTSQRNFKNVRNGMNKLAQVSKFAGGMILKKKMNRATS